MNHLAHLPEVTGYKYIYTQRSLNRLIWLTLDICAKANPFVYSLTEHRDLEHRGHVET